MKTKSGPELGVCKSWHWAEHRPGTVLHRKMNSCRHWREHNQRPEMGLSSEVVLIRGDVDFSLTPIRSRDTLTK